MKRHRQLVQEGDFYYQLIEGKRQSAKGYKPIHFFLFNDFLILAKPKRGLRAVFVSVVASEDMWEVKAAYHLTKVGMGPSDEPDILLLTSEDGEYCIKLKSQEEKDTYLAVFNEKRGAAHKLPFVDVWSAEAKKAREKEKQKNNPEKEAPPSLKGKLMTSLGKVKMGNLKSPKLDRKGNSDTDKKEKKWGKDKGKRGSGGKTNGEKEKDKENDKEKEKDDKHKGEGSGRRNTIAKLAGKISHGMNM